MWAFARWVDPLSALTWDRVKTEESLGWDLLFGPIRLDGLFSTRISRIDSVVIEFGGLNESEYWVKLDESVCLTRLSFKFSLAWPTGEPELIICIGIDKANKVVLN